MRKKLYTSKNIGFFYILGVYLLATAVGMILYRILPPEYPLLWRLFWADLAATVFVWATGWAVRNASVYDPYWSVAPVVLFTFLAVERGAFSSSSLLLLAAVGLWGIRLTWNWALTFRNLGEQDWRYDKYKNDFPRLWQLVNLSGIHLMPTVIVFLAMIPGIELLLSNRSANLWTAAGFLLCLTAVTVQFVSDRQMHIFRRAYSGQVCTTGLWKWSRHPNYLGEICLWWGVYLMGISVTGPGYGWMAIGAAVNTLLFVFISIPLMENRQRKNKPEYEEYRKRTGMLLPKIRFQP